MCCQTLILEHTCKAARILLGSKCFCITLFMFAFWIKTTYTLREKCPNTLLFLVRIFLYSNWIRRYTEYLSVFSPITEKYGPEITPYLDTSRSDRSSISFHYFLVYMQYYNIWNKLIFSTVRSNNTTVCLMGKIISEI